MDEDKNRNKNREEKTKLRNEARKSDSVIIASERINKRILRMMKGKKEDTKKRKREERLKE